MRLAGIPVVPAAALQAHQALHLPLALARIIRCMPRERHKGGHGCAVPLDHEALAGRGPLKQFGQSSAGRLDTQGSVRAGG